LDVFGYMQLSKYKIIIGIKLCVVAVLFYSCSTTCNQLNRKQSQETAGTAVTREKLEDRARESAGTTAKARRESDRFESSARVERRSRRAIVAPHANYNPYLATLDGLDGPGPPGAGFERVDLTWNAWAEPASPTPSFSPVPFLEPNDKSYQLILDLAALVYDDEPGVYSRAARSQLKDWLLKSTARDVNLKLFVIPDENFFQTARRTETLRIDLKRVRKALNEGLRLPKTPLAALQNNPDNDFSFGRVQINLRTLNHEGSGSVAIAIWADAMPVDELSIPLCVASNAAAAKNCETHINLHDSLSGIDPLRAAAQQQAFALKPDASLHFIELDSSTQVGIFRDNSWPEGEYKSWRLKSVKATRDYLQQTLLPEFDHATTQESLLTVGSELYSLLFPLPSAREARAAFAEFIARQREPQDPNNTPSIFVRMLSDDSEDPPFLVPLGLMAHEINGKQDFLGFHFRIQTPLQIQDYQPYSKCIGSWVVLAPDAGASGIPEELAEARKRFSQWFDTWQVQPIGEMNSFIAWARKDISETDPVSLFILAHQDNNSLYFEDTPRLGAAAIERQFKSPSVAVVNACATGAPGSSAIVQSLNAHGVTAVIATAAKVDRILAGDFFSVLGRNLTSNPAGREYSLGVAHFLTLKELQKMTPDPNDSTSYPYGAKVLAYELLGNSSLRVCSPPRRVRKPE